MIDWLRRNDCETRMNIQTSDSQHPSIIPIINIGPLRRAEVDRHAVAAQIRQACCEYGFFYIIDHGVDENLQRQLEELSRQFFAQDMETKMELRMALGGRAWRGYFPTGGELTSGQPDWKEGLYFGSELGADHPLVRAGTMMHGLNLFPGSLPLFRETVLQYLAVMTELGRRL